MDNALHTSTTCVGSVLKYNICLSHIPNGLTMDDIDFTAHFYMVAGKEYVVSKSEMTRVDANNYIANVDTSVTGSGASMKCRIDNLIPDGSWKEGIRPENVKTTIGEEIGNAF